MSSSYRFDGKFSKKDILGAVKKCGLEVAKSDSSSSTQFCITDGECYIWAYNDRKGVYGFERYGNNYDAYEAILLPLAEELGADVINEDEEQPEDIGEEE